MNKRHEELIHRLIDGELSAEERAELDSVLATSPAARAFQEKMVLLQRAGESRVDVTPPHALKSQVMDRIRQGRRQAVRVAQPRWAFLRAWQNVLTPRVVYGLAAGLIIGFGIGAMAFTSAVGGSSSSTLDFSGTVGVPPALAEFSPIDAEDFEGRELAVGWTAQRLDDLVAIRVQVEATEAAAATLVYDPEAVVCQGIQRLDDGGVRVTIESGTVAVTQVHDGEFIALMSIASPVARTIGLNVATEGETYRHVISIQN